MAKHKARHGKPTWWRDVIHLVVIVAAVFATVATVGWATAVTTSNGVTVTQTCPYEDGHPNGRPCLWRDPDTGTVHVVDSSEYRDTEPTECTHDVGSIQWWADQVCYLPYVMETCMWEDATPEWWQDPACSGTDETPIPTQTPIRHHP